MVYVPFSPIIGLPSLSAKIISYALWDVTGPPQPYLVPVANFRWETLSGTSSGPATKPLTGVDFEVSSIWRFASL